MSVKTKALFTTSLILLVMVAAIYTIVQVVLRERFARLEIDTQRAKMEQVSKSVARIYAELGYEAQALARRTELIALARGETTEVSFAQIVSALYPSPEIALLALANPQGEILFSQVYDQRVEQVQAGPAELKPLMARGGLFWQIEVRSDPLNRLLVTDEAAYLLTARSIIGEDGAVTGTVLFGRAITPALLDQIRAETGLTITFFLPENAPPDFESVRGQIDSPKSVYLNTPDENILDGFVLLEGVSAPFSGVIQATIPRTIYQQGNTLLSYLLLGMIGVAAAALLVNAWITTTLLIRPLEKLAQRVKGAANLKEQIRSLSQPGSSELDLISVPLQTALLRAQEAQVESQDRQMMVMRLYEQAREGFAILEPQSLLVLEANQEFYRLLLLAPDANSRITLPDLMDRVTTEDDGYDLIADLRQVLAGGGGTREFRLGAENILRTLEISLYPIEATSQLYLYAILRDVSERNELARNLQERLNETILLNRIITATTSNLEPEALLRLACRELAPALRIPQAAFAVYIENGRAIRFTAEYIQEGRPSILGITVDITGRKLADKLHDLQTPLVYSRQAMEKELQPLLTLLDYRQIETLLLVPLRVRDKAIGFLSLESNEPREFSPAEIQLARNVILAVAQAYDVAQLYRTLQDELSQRQRAEMDLAARERFQEALIKVQTWMLGGPSWADVYPLVLRELGEVAQADRVYIFRNHTGLDGGLYTSLAAEWTAQGVRRQIDNPAMQDLTFSGSLQRIYEVLSSGQPYSELVRDIDPEERKPYQDQGIRSFLLLPLNSGGVFSGLIGFENIHYEREWTQAEIAILSVAAAAISMSQDRYDAVDRMRQSEERYRVVVENAHDVIFQMDLSGRFVFLNPSWERVTNIALKDALGIPFWKVVPPAMLQPLQTAYRLLREQVSDQYHQMIVLTEDGEAKVWLDTFARLIKDAQGKGLLIAGTMIDITSFKRIEYQLRKNEEALRGLYDITSSQQLSFDQKIADLLRMGSQTFDMESASLSWLQGDEMLIAHVYPENGGPVGPVGTVVKLSDTFSREIIRANEPVGVENIAETDWADIPMHTEGRILALIGTPVIVEGDAYGILYFTSLRQRLHSISVAEKEFVRLMAQWVGAEIERDRSTRRLRQYNEEIAQKSSELAIARDQALEASRLKSEFLATMSHEIRTPLNAVIGMTELLMETPLNAQQDEYSRIIQESGKSLLSIINDILDFSKIEAGRMNLEEVEFELLPVVEGVVDMFLQAAHAKGLSIMSFVTPQIPQFVVGDPSRIRQVLVNLVGNAVKFTEFGEVIIRVGLLSQDEQSMRLMVKVNDSGIGLSEVARRRLFQPFTQADGSTTRKYGGTGLGLAITKRLVEMMGGDIGVYSEEGVGSTFWFTLNLRPNPITSTPPFPGLKISGLRVLVADFDSAHRRIICAYLRSWKAQVEPARAVIEAWEMLASAQEEGRPYELLIWGFSESEESWSEVRHSLEQLLGLNEMRTIFLADLEQRGSITESFIPGKSACVYRPVKQSSLFDEIANLMVPPDQLSLTFRRQVESRPEPEQVLNGDHLILLAEDNPANQRLALAQLERLGFRIELAVNGQRALDAYTTDPNRYDLILMDCQMPVMDGFAAAQKIREFELRLGRHIPIVAMTANAMQGDREACLAAGMDDYIPKPVTMDQLRRVLLKVEANEAAPPRSPLTVDGHDPLDRDVLRGLRDLQEEGAADFLTELIDLYIEDSALLMDEIRSGLRIGNTDVLRQAAHTLKGSSGSLGARAFSRMCHEAELLGRANRLEEMKKMLPSFEEEYHRVRESLLRERVVDA
jgi:PAS domain S-box-containing protein